MKTTSKLIWARKISVFDLSLWIKMGEKNLKMEKKIVERELSYLMEFTLRLEDELNSFVDRE